MLWMHWSSRMRSTALPAPPEATLVGWRRRDDKSVPSALYDDLSVDYCRYHNGRLTAL
jgi:hypothetical protein